MANTEIAIFGGGCFWCTEAVFKTLKGVISVEPGYAGGIVANPTYEQVSSGKTGHAEVIRIEYDPDKISFESLMTVFFASHDPTTPNRQGNDVGEQYRSIILYTTESQKSEAMKFIEDLNNSNVQGNLIVTEIRPLEKYYPAENYHKNYYETHPDNSYCEIIINPKLEKVQKQFTQLLKDNNK